MPTEKRKATTNSGSSEKFNLSDPAVSHAEENFPELNDISIDLSETRMLDLDEDEIDFDLDETQTTENSVASSVSDLSETRTLNPDEIDFNLDEMQTTENSIASTDSNLSETRLLNTDEIALTLNETQPVSPHADVEVNQPILRDDPLLPTVLVIGRGYPVEVRAVTTTPLIHNDYETHFDLFNALPIVTHQLQEFLQAKAISLNQFSALLAMLNEINHDEPQALNTPMLWQNISPTKKNELLNSAQHLDELMYLLKQFPEPERQQALAAVETETFNRLVKNSYDVVSLVNGYYTLGLKEAIDDLDPHFIKQRMQTAVDLIHFQQLQPDCRNEVAQLFLEDYFNERVTSAREVAQAIHYLTQAGLYAEISEAEKCCHEAVRNATDLHTGLAELQVVGKRYFVELISTDKVIAILQTANNATQIADILSALPPDVCDDVIHALGGDKWVELVAANVTDLATFMKMLAALPPNLAEQCIYQRETDTVTLPLALMNQVRTNADFARILAVLTDDAGKMALLSYLQDYATDETLSEAIDHPGLLQLVQVLPAKSQSLFKDEALVAVMRRTQRFQTEKQVQSYLHGLRQLVSVGEQVNATSFSQRNAHAMQTTREQTVQQLQNEMRVAIAEFKIRTGIMMTKTAQQKYRDELHALRTSYTAKIAALQAPVKTDLNNQAILRFDFVALFASMQDNLQTANDGVLNPLALEQAKRHCLRQVAQIIKYHPDIELVSFNLQGLTEADVTLLSQAFAERNYKYELPRVERLELAPANLLAANQFLTSFQREARSLLAKSAEEGAAATLGHLKPLIADGLQITINPDDLRYIEKIIPATPDTRADDYLLAVVKAYQAINQQLEASTGVLRRGVMNTQLDPQAVRVCNDIVTYVTQLTTQPDLLSQHEQSNPMSLASTTVSPFTDSMDLTATPLATVPTDRSIRSQHFSFSATEQEAGRAHQLAIEYRLRYKEEARITDTQQLDLLTDLLKAYLNPDSNPQSKQELEAILRHFATTDITPIEATLVQNATPLKQFLTDNPFVTKLKVSSLQPIAKLKLASSITYDVATKARQTQLFNNTNTKTKLVDPQIIKVSPKKH